MAAPSPKQPVALNAPPAMLQLRKFATASPKAVTWHAATALNDAAACTGGNNAQNAVFATFRTSTLTWRHKARVKISWRCQPNLQRISIITINALGKFKEDGTSPSQGIDRYITDLRVIAKKSVAKMATSRQNMRRVDGDAWRGWCAMQMKDRLRRAACSPLPKRPQVDLRLQRNDRHAAPPQGGLEPNPTSSQRLVFVAWRKSVAIKLKIVAPLGPENLAGYEKHRKRVGGDDGHILENPPGKKRRLIGPENWAAEALAEISDIKAQNFAAELEALKKRNRRKDIQQRLAEGPHNPWRPTRHGPMREVILSANKKWFDADPAAVFDEGVDKN